MMKKVQKQKVILGMAILAIMAAISVSHANCQAKTTSDAVVEGGKNQLIAGIVPIPVFLSYDGSFWIDQYGTIMDKATAESFLNRNPQYALEIIYLNNNPCYTVSLQNQERSSMLNDLHKTCYQYASDGDLDCDQYLKAFETAIANGKAQQGLAKIAARLRGNGATDYIRWAEEQYLKRLRSDYTAEYNTSAKTAARTIFFAELAIHEERGDFEEICESPLSPTTTHIPVILCADGKTWIDQDGEIIQEQDGLLWFLNDHREYAKAILELNQRHDYLVNATNIEHQEFIADQLNFYAREEDYQTQGYTSWKIEEHEEEYEWIVDEILDNPPSTEILRSYINKYPYISTEIVGKLIDDIERKEIDVDTRKKAHSGIYFLECRGKS